MDVRHIDQRSAFYSLFFNLCLISACLCVIAVRCFNVLAALEAK